MTDTPTTAAEMREAAAFAILALRREPDGTNETMIYNRAVTKCSMAVLEILPPPSDDEMVEKVARALFAALADWRKAREAEAVEAELSAEDAHLCACLGPIPYCRCQQRQHEAMARAAIAAMRGE